MLALVLVLLGAASPQCAEAFSGAPAATKKGQLLAARAALRACASDACPVAMRPLCADDLRQLELRVPSVVLGARDSEGRDLTAVRTTLDGERLADTLDGRALDLDPGPHTLVFEAAGAAPVKLDVLVREGEKARALTAVFAPARELASPAAESDARPPPQDVRPGTAAAPASASRSLGVVFWVSSLVAVAGAISWAAMGASGVQGRAALEPCRGHCDEASVGRVSALFIAADVGMVVTAVGAVVAVISFLIR